MAQAMTSAPAKAQEADQWARPGSKVRLLYDCLADGHWHTSSELDVAFRARTEAGWTWDGAKAQLKAKLERHGGTIVSEKIPDRLESRHRMVLPRQAAVAPHVARTDRYLELLGERERKRAELEERREPNLFEEVTG